MTRPVAKYGLIDTVFGSMLLAMDGTRVVALKFGVDAARLPEALDALTHELRGVYTLEPGETAVRAGAQQLKLYLSGKRDTLDLAFDISWTTGFRRRVLEECARIPRGHVATYADLARRAGSPRAFRAVGNTMRTNPVPILIPCHRVVGSNGSLTGFGGGLDMKDRLLRLEGARA